MKGLATLKIRKFRIRCYCWNTEQPHRNWLLLLPLGFALTPVECSGTQERLFISRVATWPWAPFADYYSPICQDLNLSTALSMETLRSLAECQPWPALEEINSVLPETQAVPGRWALAVTLNFSSEIPLLAWSLSTYLHVLWRPGPELGLETVKYTGTLHLHWIWTTTSINWIHH